MTQDNSITPQTDHELVERIKELMNERDKAQEELAKLRDASQRLLNVIGFGFAQKEMFAKEYLQLESLLLKSSPPEQTKP